MKITRWLLAAILFFKKKPLRMCSLSLCIISTMADNNWFTVMKNKRGKLTAKKDLPTFHTPAASLPGVLQPAKKVPATKDLLRTLGLESVPAPKDGNCFLHCAADKLKEADSEKYAATTHVSLRAEMCAELLLNRNTYQPHHRGGTDASFTRYVEEMKRPKTHVDHLGKLLSKP